MEKTIQQKNKDLVLVGMTYGVLFRNELSGLGLALRTHLAVSGPDDAAAADRDWSL